MRRSSLQPKRASTKALHDRQPQDHKAGRSRPVQTKTIQTRERTLPKSNWRAGVDRRTLVKSTAALAAAQFASPFVIRARAADPVRLGLDNPLTGTYSAYGKNELVGCQMALDEINAKGGILGRPVELIVEDSTSGDAGAAVQKARKLIEGDKVDFLLGKRSTRRSPSPFSARRCRMKRAYCTSLPSGHTDAVTGASCHWNVFRVCNTTQTEANAVAASLITEYGKNLYYITPDYAYGHTLESGLIKASAALDGKRIGGDLTPARLLQSIFPLRHLHQGAGGEPGRHHFPCRGRRHAERPQAGGAVRPAEQGASRRRAAGDGAARRPPA